MRKVFIINPNAGKGGYKEQLVSFLEKNHIKYYFTSYAGEETEIVKKEAAKGDEVIIFSCGGEGTNYEVINGIVNFPNATIGFVPCGTGNDFIKYFGDKAPFLDLENQMEGERFYLDLIKVESDDKTYYGVNSCSAGMDAMVCKNTDKFKKIPFVSGSLAYGLGIVNTVLRKFDKNMDFIIDGKEYKDIPSLFAVCANAPYYGGGYKCSPNANPSDGELNFSIIATRSKLKLISILDKYKKGTHINLDYCYHGTCKKMEYHCSDKIAFNIDGEVYDFSNVTCEIIPKAIKFILPKSLISAFSNKLISVENKEFELV